PRRRTPPAAAARRPQGPKWSAERTPDPTHGPGLERTGALKRAAMTRNHSLLSLTLLATAVHALIFLATALYLIFFGKNNIAAVSWSLTFYYENASKVMAGMVPYRDFLFEYPLLSFPLFLIPRLLVSDLDNYKVAFVVEILLFDAAAIYLIARH